MPDQTYRKVPLDKIFEFPQDGRDFKTHPQISRRNNNRGPITHQPSLDSALDPMYITSRGRSSTFSQLPEHQEEDEEEDSPSSPEPPPFTPPPQFFTRPKILGEPSTAAIPESVESPENKQEVKFALYFDVQRRTLIIHLQQAFNLPPREVHKTAGTYVTLYLLPSREEIHQTTVSAGVNPVFNQVFEFGGILTDEVRQQVLVMELFYHDKFTRNHAIGTMVMSLKEVDLYGMDITKEIGDGRELLKVGQRVSVSITHSHMYSHQDALVCVRALTPHHTHT